MPASQSERGTLQHQRAEGYLHGLMGYARGARIPDGETVKSIMVPWGKITGGLQRTAWRLPEGITTAMGLPALTWKRHFVDHDTVPRLYSAVSENNTSSSARFEDGIAVLAISKYQEPQVDENGKIMGNEKGRVLGDTIPVSIHLAGVNPALNRIVYVKYDVQTGNLVRLGFSLSQREKMLPSSSFAQNTGKGVAMLDANKDYEVLGLVTKPPALVTTAMKRSTDAAQIIVVNEDGLNPDTDESNPLVSSIGREINLRREGTNLPIVSEHWRPGNDAEILWDIIIPAQLERAA